jgi:nucleotide sugar dehydrogenase
MTSSTSARPKTLAKRPFSTLAVEPAPQTVAKPRVVRAPHPTFDVAVVGLGYVGLPTALSFYRAGKRVLGLEVSESRLRDISQDRAELVPSDAALLTEANGDARRFTLSTDPDLLSRADGVLICVPTPVDDYLVPELTALAGACATVVAHARPGQTIILTSTSYVGSTQDLLAAPLLERGLRPGSDVSVAISAERINPGRDHMAHEDVPRVVGGTTPRCTEAAIDLVAGYARGVHRVSSAEAAELTKLYENSFRAVNIALANEFADISGALDLDIAEVTDAAATKPYGFMAFQPGPGVGGHCIPCDPHYLLWQLRAKRHGAPLLEAAMTAVAHRPAQVVRRAQEVLAARARPLLAARILVLGASYKPGVADLRESPALEVMERLTRAGADVSYSDALVPRLRLDGAELLSVDRPDQDWDLVIVHTVHPGTELKWLERQPSVLDATYRLDNVPHRETV